MGNAERKAEKLAKQQARAEKARAAVQPAASEVPPALPQPAVGVEPSAAKTPATQQEPEDSESYRPAWLFRRLDHKGPWPVDAIGANLNDVRDALKNFETMTWGELRGTGSHPVSLDQLCTEAQKRLRELKLDTYDELWSLRIGGKPRLWGIKDGRALLLLWWDPEHQVCPSAKKHT